MLLPDTDARQQATDPAQSFIVQAPAGSGKTELLTQRFLRLLSRVQAPEQIIALTFTRKAAHEMRERIMAALHKASSEYVPKSPHEEQTLAYAKAALLRDEQEQWQILKNPSRLKIMTIDALCQSLVHAMPFQEKPVPFANIAEDATLLYQKAVTDFFAYALEESNLQEPLSILLSHLDNRQDRLFHFLEELLAGRDLWINQLFEMGNQTKADLEDALESIKQHELDRLLADFPNEILFRLQPICQQLAKIEDDPLSLRYALQNWDHPLQLNEAEALGLAATLLTKSKDCRKSFDHHVGLRKDNCPKALYATLKEESKILCAELLNHPACIERLQRMTILPSSTYETKQWASLQAVFAVLPMLLAHLQVTFSEANQVDFSAIMQQALAALGSEDAPTDLALYLDYSIHHLLVDEFQDTSMQQFQLLSRLVQGFQADDAKTLFIVGDPMQSIYRFRQAEVGLFLKVKAEGLGPVALQFLELNSNFRSTTPLVSWVNQQFANIFPKRNDMESGAVQFHPATAIKSDEEASFVRIEALADKKQEAQAILEIIQQELAQPSQQTIAILVRTRSQLKSILPLLKQHRIPFQGVEIEQLAHLPHIQEVYNLLKALLIPGNRLYWLALLRGPLCGLSLQDLHCLANQNKKKPIVYSLQQLDKLKGLSEDGRQRLQWVSQILLETLDSRHQRPLVDWLRDCLSQLQSHVVFKAEELSELEQFWVLLDSTVDENQAPNWTLLDAKVTQLYSQRSTASRLQIMTIHKSKGLEFDSVIMPGLSSKSRNHQAALFKWLYLPNQRDGSLLLMSPIKASDAEVCPLYNYLVELDKEKEAYEKQRLFYVAVTRAKKRLYLLDNQHKRSESTFRGMLNEESLVLTDGIAIENAAVIPLPTLYRLPLSYYFKPPERRLKPPNILPPLAHSSAKLQGIIIHAVLQWICTHHPKEVSDIPWGMVQSRFQQQGLQGDALSTAVEQTEQQLKAFLEDPIGQWIAKAQDDEQNEYELMVQEAGQLQTKIIDRTFYEHSIRWIIDFKTGKDDELSVLEHKKQVAGYQDLFPEEITRGGIYYLASNRWVVW